MRRQTWTRVLGAGLVVVTATGAVAVLSSAKHTKVAAGQVAVGTTRVERRTLSAVTSRAGILTYRGQPDGAPYAVINRAEGTYTKLPTAGQVIFQGRVLYRVNNRAVVLLYGSTPAYRTLSPGTTGPDVVELNADLVTLGYANRAQLRSRPARFGAPTRAAVLKLQAALGLSRSGTLRLGQVVFEPSALRVTSVAAQVGASTRIGETVIQGTSTGRQVQVALNEAEHDGMEVGDRVSITLPDNRTTSGVVSSVGAVATCPSSSGSGSSGSSSAALGTDTCASGSATPTITVGVTPSHPATTRRWDQAPVQVGITTDSVRDALVVPVTALLARSGGGYAVEVAGRGARHHLVPVVLGLFDDADGLVQVTGSGLAAGQEVVVPST